MAQKISALSLGAKIKMGTIYGYPIEWVLVDKNHAGYPVNSATFASARLLKMMPFDAMEPSNPTVAYKSGGNNRYATSNIRQWMNSDAAASAWYEAKHEYDASPTADRVSAGVNSYYQFPGFLNGFTASEKAILLPTQLQVLKNSNPENGQVETVTDKVFLFSLTEITGEDIRYVYEGAQIAYFVTKENRTAIPTKQAVDNSGYQTVGFNDYQAWYYLTRSIYPGSASSVYGIMGNANKSEFTAAYGNASVRPGINLSLDTLVSDSPDSSGCYTVIPNLAPSAPNGITVPETVNGGGTINVSWGSSTDPDGNLAGYILERSVAGGSYSQVYKGTLQSYTDTITFGWTSVAYRVKAYDQLGVESAYTTSATRTVTNNRAPVISGSDSDLGSFSSSWTDKTYTVTDADGDTVTVVETLDGVQLRSFTANLGSENTISFTADAWQQVLNGTHTLKVTATDDNGAVSVRTWTFTKAQNSLVLMLQAALPADDMPIRCVINVNGRFPTGSTLTVEVCNNANDDAPTWEDITSKVLSHSKHYFTNKEKTADSWGVNVRVSLSRGTAEGSCYIESVSGNFA